MSRPPLLNTTIGEYHLVDFLGAGGMGEVYRGVHAKIGRVVAVKVLTTVGHNPDFMDRFLNEARIQASLHHQNIATLYDFLEYQGRPCIVMEYVDGQTLSDRLKSYGPLPVTETLAVFPAVAEAIGYIHSHGIVHRDIKSNNIKLSAKGEVKLLDFGIAKTGSTPNLTMAGYVIGTLEYLPPDLLRGGAADPRSDIWALGILLYEMLTGQVPFRATNFGDLYEKITGGAYVPATTLNPAVPRPLEAVIQRCLKHNPAERFQSARELVDAVRQAAITASQPHARLTNQQPIAARPTAPAPKLWWGLSAAAVLTLSVFAGGLYFLLPMIMSDNSPEKAQATSVQPDSRKAAPPPGRSTPNAPAAAAGEARSIKIEVFEGRAEVFRNGELAGTTPYELKARVGERINLVLRCSGYTDKPVEFTVSANRDTYSFQMHRQ